MTEVFWNMVRIKKAEELLKNGGTFSSLALHFKVPRNAIAGMCHRYGIKKGAAETRATYKDRGALTAIKARVRREREAIDNGEEWIDTPVDIVGTVAFPPGPHRCVNIIGEPKDLRCCGRPTVKGSPYCADHCRINTPNRLVALTHEAKR